MRAWRSKPKSEAGEPRARREPRQSPRLTKRALRQSLSGGGRKWVKQVWQAATQMSAEMSRLSPLTTPLGNRLVESYAAERGLEGNGELQRALRIAVVAGYASRVVLVGPTDQPSLGPSAFQLRNSDDATALGNDGGAVNRLMDPVRRIASDRFDSVMTLPPEVWTGYVKTAAMKLQGQLCTKTVTWKDLLTSRIEEMLRYGYVLRCLDEALDAEPEFNAIEDGSE